LQGFFYRDYAQLAPIRTNDPNLRCPDFLVDIFLLCQGDYLLSDDGLNTLYGSIPNASATKHKKPEIKVQNRSGIR
jgi:hypothetical protein